MSWRVDYISGLVAATEPVKDKQRLHVKFERAREPFRQVGDLWSATFTREGGRLVTAEAYQQAIAALAKPKVFSRIGEEDWFRQAVAIARRGDMECFHWELEFPEAFFDNGGRRVNAGFDAVIGNPPYDVLSEAETGHDLSAFKSFIAHDPVYEPSRRGKNNLYKLFICRSLELLRDGGLMGYITPMAVLGDDQAADIRRRVVEVGAFTGIEAFPQKDNPARRVFSEAKLSTVVFTLRKGSAGETDEEEFVARVHPGRMIESNSPSLKLSTASIPLYDPVNFTIVSCSQADWDLATRVTRSGRTVRLGQLCTSYQGEVNETIEKPMGSLSIHEGDGPLVLRGSNITLYAVREASQGEDFFILESVFLKDKSPTSKAFHSKQERVGFQRSSPQNNFRRIVAAIIPPGNYCFDTVSYVPKSDSQLPLVFLVALLNSKFLDWYFRLGSTNSKVNEYQFNNLPCPVFADTLETVDEALQDKALNALTLGDTEHVFGLLQPALNVVPFSPAVRAVIMEAANRIIDIEERRGEISRAARSALAPEAQPYQDLIDRIFYAMAGLSASEAAGLEERLAQML